MRAARSFADWQADYAAHDIATFPVGSDKKPLVNRYNRFGLRASSAVARRYPDAPAIGFMAGSRNRITIGDVDEVGEKPLQRFLDRHGDTPVIVRTASGKHHAWYRHNGEQRIIRPVREINVDILGGGLVRRTRSQKKPPVSYLRVQRYAERNADKLKAVAKLERERGLNTHTLE